MAWDAHRFLLEFKSIFDRERAAAEAVYHSSTDFTPFITKQLNALLSHEQRKSQNEYFRIDAISWTAKADTVEKPGDIHLRPHLWDLEIAVEHENDHNDWMDEVVKLAHIACPLRVVIGYMPWNKRDADQKYLDHVSKWLETLRCADNVRRGEFMIILGNCDTGKTPERYFGYKGYLFNPERFRFEPMQE